MVAWDGTEAIRRAREDHPHVILMSRQLPRIDGLEATRRIRASPELGAIPIIAFTALDLPGDREQCLEAGMDAYLAKPVSMPGLVKMLKTHLIQVTDGQTV